MHTYMLQMCNIFIMLLHAMQNYKYYSNILSIQPICRYTRYSVACIIWQYQPIYLKCILEPIYLYMCLSIQRLLLYIYKTNNN